MINKLALILIFITCFYKSTYSQDKSITVNLHSEILWAGVDRPGDLYLVLKTGEVQKFNTDGEQIGKYQFQSPPTIFEPSDGTKSFYYFRDGNIFGDLSYDLSSIASQRIEPFFAVHPLLICSSNHELWILDSGSGEIKKTNNKKQTIAFESSLHGWNPNQIDSIKYMREYQNYLFVLNISKGIQMYDHIGNYVTTIKDEGISDFNFLGQEVYYTKGSEIILTDLFTMNKRVIRMEKSYRFALIVENFMFCVDKNMVVIHLLKDN